MLVTLKPLSSPWSSCGILWPVCRHQVCSCDRSHLPNSPLQQGTCAHCSQLKSLDHLSHPGRRKKNICMILRNIRLWHVSECEKNKRKIFHFTWQASTPPLKTPAQIMRGVIPSSNSLLHTVMLIMRTSAFCNTDATSSGAGRRHFLSLLTILASYYIIICSQLHSVSVLSGLDNTSFTSFVVKFRHPWQKLYAKCAKKCTGQPI